MRLTTVILIASLMQVSASTFGQRVTLSKANASLFSVLKDIRKQTGYDFYYDQTTIPQGQKVNVSVSNATLDEALSTTLKGLNLIYEIDGKIVTIKTKENPSFLENIVSRFLEINVSGRVVDANGRGLPGASVTVKGKGGKAVSTGANGSFYLKGVDENAVLVISFIGYVPKEVKAAANLGDVILELSTSKLDEVQVIAYGTTTQRLSTGNVTTIKADVIEKQPVNNPLLALQGRVPGLFIEQATGFAGTGVKVRIQGQNSLNNGNDPFYVIDGVPYISQLLSQGNSILGNSGTSGLNSSPLNFINPSDIESIDVLKDADATAIYGSRASNGAILITTKRGKAGDTKVDLNIQSGWAKVPRRLKLMNSQQYLEMRREGLKNDGLSPTPGPYGDNDLNGNWDNSKYTDWQKELIGGTASYRDLNTSVSGGNDQTTFLIGAGYHKETNVFPGDFADQKGSVHFSINNTSGNRKFKIQFSGGYLFDNNEMPAVDLTSHAMIMAPVAPSLYALNGSINWEPNSEGNSTFLINPIGYLYDSFLNNTSNLNTNMVLGYSIIPGLEIKSSFGYSKLSSKTTQKALLQSTPPENIAYAQRATVFGDDNISSWSIEPQITYHKDLYYGKLEVLIGTTIQQNRSNGSQIYGLGFSNDLVMDDILSASEIGPISSTNFLYKYNALFGRVNYNWNDKYILNLTGRRDGSSRFGPRSQFHNFAAAGLAWIFSNEKFIQEKFAFVSFGKIRGSYGVTGSDQIGNYQYLSLYSPMAQDIPYQGITSYRPNGIANPNLEWEETRKLQFGMDLGFLRDKILFSANYYANRSSNQLDAYALPSTTGFSVITRNQPYTIENSGWELMLSSTNFQTKDFSWKTSLNFTIPKTILVAYPNQSLSSDYYSKIVGKPLNSGYIYHFLGVDPATGVYQFEDKSGKPTSTPNSIEDRISLISTDPKYYGGFQNTFSYRDFQLDFMLSFVKQIGANYSFGNQNFSAGQFTSGLSNQPASLLNRWQSSGDKTSIQKFTTGSNLNESLKNAYQSDAALSDASYVRLKNVSFSWRIPERWRKGGLTNCSLYVQGQNLWTITSYDGLDPETKSSNTLPPLRVITLGIKVTL